MSSFFGIFRPQGGSVNLEAFEDMRKASERDGFDVMSMHVEEKIAMGHLMLRVSPEDQYDQQPLKSSCGRYLMVGHFRLDYRDELGDKIGLTQSELDNTPDSMLAMRAYQKWGDECVHHLHGDWTFVIYDYIPQSLGLFKDRFGSSALFYGLVDNVFIFTTDPFIFEKLQAKFQFELNENAFCRLGIEGFVPKVGETLLKNIFSLAGGTFLEIDKTGTSRKFNYYKLVKKYIRYNFQIDYILNFHSLIHLVVRNRLRVSKIGLFLSAGLDSSMIAYFAAKELEFKDKKLSTFTSYPYYLNNIRPEKKLKISERFYVESFTSKFKNIHSNFFNFKDFKHSELINSHKVYDILNPIISPNSFWLDGINKFASESGMQFLLNGQMGNYVVSWNAPFYSLSSLLRLRFSVLYKIYMRNLRLKNSNSISFIYSELVKPFRYLVRNKKNRLLYFFFKRGLVKTFLKVDLKRLQIDFSKDYHHLFSSLIGPSKLRFFLFRSNMSQVGQKWYVNSNENKIRSADPFTDIRVVEYSFSIPEYLYNSYGDKKYLYKRLMQGVLEDVSISKVSGIPQSYDIGRRLQSDYEFKKIIEDILGKRLLSAYFDFGYIRNLLIELDSTNKDVILNKKASELLKFISLYLFATKFAGKGLTK